MGVGTGGWYREVYRSSKVYRAHGPGGQGGQFRINLSKY